MIEYKNGMVIIDENAKMSATDDGQGNVSIAFKKKYIVSDDNNGNVSIN